MIGPSEHPYHRAIAPMMWVFVGLAGIELVVVHFLLALWNWRVALAVSLLSLAGVAWLVRAIIAFRRLPVAIDGETLVLRVGTLAAISVPIAQVVGTRTVWGSGAHKAPDVRSLALIAHPNVLIDLSAPIPGRRRPIVTIAHRFDDPAAFVASLAAAREAAVARGCGDANSSA